MGRHAIDAAYQSRTYSKIPKQLIRDNCNFTVLFKQDEIIIIVTSLYSISMNQTNNKDRSWFMSYLKVLFRYQGIILLYLISEKSTSILNQLLVPNKWVIFV